MDIYLNHTIFLSILLLFLQIYLVLFRDSPGPVLVQKVVYSGKGAGPRANSSHELNALCRLAQCQHQRRLLWQILGLWSRNRQKKSHITFTSGTTGYFNRSVKLWRQNAVVATPLLCLCTQFQCACVCACASACTPYPVWHC